MKISYTQLQNLFEDTLPAPEKLAEVFNFHFAEVESIDQEGNDTILDIKVLPDRAGYAKLYEGIALEASAILGLKRKPVTPIASSGRIIEADAVKIRETLGLDISAEEIVKILGRLDIPVTQKGDLLTVDVPVNRPDLQDWRDLPEEVARIHGYDKIPAKTPVGQPVLVKKPFYYIEKIRNILAGEGFSEVYLYSLTAKGEFHIEKSVATDKNYLRTNLSDGIVKALDLNVKNADLLGLSEICIFEIGKVFPKEGEQLSLSIGIKNATKKPGAGFTKETWKEKEKIKAVRDRLLAALRANASILCTIDDTGGLISIDGKVIGHSNNVEGVLELNLEALIKALPEPSDLADLDLPKSVSLEYKKFSPYPFMVRDIAVFVPNSVKSDDVWNVIRKGIESADGMELLVRNALFDEFKKDGKVSYAFRMVFQSMEKTLTDEESNKIMERVNAEVQAQGWEVR
jgi:phenylalanyl-tRNA synthetase beta chain